MKASVLDLGLKEVKVLNNGIILFRRPDNELCGRKVIKVNKVVTSINDLSDHEVVKYLKTYFNSMNLGFPIEIKSIFTPLSKEKVVSELNKKIQSLLIDLEVNPNNIKAKTELEKLSKLRDKIAKHGLQPFDLIVFYSVEACGTSEDEVVNALNSRADLLMKTLGSLGIVTSELKGIEGMALLHIFFRGFPPRLVNLILTKLLRLRYSFKMASPTLALFAPHIINARTRFDLRSQGIYLGYNIITSEEIFWNIGNCLNPHVLVLGPSGIGKTETLITLLLRTYLTYSTKVFIVDVKNEYVGRLLMKGFKPWVVDLGVSIGLGIVDLLKYIPKNLRAAFLTELISDSMILKGDRELTASLFKVLSEASELQDEVLSNFWEVAKDLTLGIDDEYVQYRLMRIFNTIETLECDPPLIEALSSSESITVINLSHISALGVDYLNLSVAAFFNVINLLYMNTVRESHIPRVQVVIDEAWQFMFNKVPLLIKLIKLGRGYGISIALATQSLNDLGELGKDLIENIGLFIALPSPDILYWKELSNYMRISYEEIKDYTLLLSKGDALIRILPDPRPIPIKLDHEI